MTKQTILILLVGAAAGVLVSSGAAQEEAESVLGGFLSHQTEERFDISIGVTRSGEAVRETRRVEMRETVVVPTHYGHLVSVTQDGARSILWYRDQQGAVRNVVVPGAAHRIVRVETSGKLVAEIPRTF